MRSIITILWCVLVISVFTISTYPYETLPANLDGTMKTYEFSSNDSVTPWSGTLMKPIAISYVARHGSRYLSSEKKVFTLLKAIDKARKAHTLTADGEAFSSLLDTVCIISDGKWGYLSPIGEMEEDKLGIQVCEQIGALSARMRGNAISSSVPRVVRTMWDFLYPLAARSTANSITTSEGPQFSPLVRFFETDSLYHTYLTSGNWEMVYREYFQRKVPYEPAYRLFGEIGDNQYLKELSMDLYGVLQSLRCTGLPAPTTRWMSESEYKECWEVSNLEHYLTRSLTPYSTLAMNAVTPLLKDIIVKTDISISNVRNNIKEINGNFWFGHAETLLPLFSLMDLPGCVALQYDMDNIHNQWKDYEITPLAANLLIVLLEGVDNEVRVALRLNGEWVSPLSNGCKAPEWKIVRDYWLLRMRSYAEGIR